MKKESAEPISPLRAIFSEIWMDGEEGVSNCLPTSELCFNRFLKLIGSECPQDPRSDQTTVPWYLGMRLRDMKTSGLGA